MNKKPLSGAYWYTVTDNDILNRNNQVRTIIHGIAILLQVVAMILPGQDGLEYVTKNISSYAYVFLWTVFIMLGVGIYTIICDFVKNKIQKRIPVEKAPKKGFKKRAFLATEINVVANFIVFVLYLSIVCIHYNGIGLLAMFITLIATAGTVWAREIERRSLCKAELIKSEDNNNDKADN